MIIYLFVFSISLLFTKGACRKGPLHIIHVFALVLPIVLLTFRAPSVGTDTPSYIGIFESISEFDTLFDYFLFSRLEPGFALLMFVIDRSGGNINWAYFACALLCIVPVYIGCMKLKNSLSPVYSMALYYFMFYHYTFNIVRQSIAMSLLFLAMVYLLSGKKRNAVVIWLFAISFHNVALIFIMLYLLYVYKDMNRTTRNRTLFASILTLGILLYYNQAYYASSIDYYSHTYLESGKVGMQFSYLGEMMLNFLIVYLAWKRKRKDFWYFLMIAGSVLFFISISNLGPFLFRVANCLDIFLLIYIPLSLKTISPSRRLDPVYFSFAVFYWMFVFVYNNSGETIPYIFSY